MKKHTTLELTIATKYVQEWNVWEALRELVQNAKDADDIGQKMSMSYVTNTKEPQLRIVNDGVTLTRDNLLFGSTSKDERRDQRGQFGEGLKLAMLVLARLGYKVRIRTGGDQWVPELGHSEAFDSELLMVKTSPVEYRETVQVDVIGIEQHHWDKVVERCLFLGKTKPQKIELGYDSILTDDNQGGNLYVKGIYVSHMPGLHRYGYDLWDVKIDRDRQLADPYDLQYEIRKVLTQAIEREKISVQEMYEMLQDTRWVESKIAAETYYGGEMARVMAQHFRSIHGEDAIPLSDFAQAEQARSFGLRGVQVKGGLYNLLKLEIGDFDKIKDSRGLEVKKLYEPEELEETELENALWVMDMAAKTGEHYDEIAFCDFWADTVLGSHELKGQHVRIQLSRQILKDKHQLLATMIHELAHNYSGDGTFDHAEARDKLFCNIILGVK